MRLLLLLAITAIASSAQAREWELVHEENGIVVHRKDVAGRDLPVFRGRGAVNASIYQVMAVLIDAPRRPEWLHRCVEAKVIEKLGEFATVNYSRTDAPWPVEDRDAVMIGQLFTIEPGVKYRAEFHGIPDPRMPPRPDAVRMKRLHGHWLLTSLSPNKTHVEYLVDADPGGILPDWLVKQASKELPYKTLLNLRRQTRKTRGQYDAFLDRWDPERRPKDAPAPTQPEMWKEPGK